MPAGAILAAGAIAAAAGPDTKAAGPAFEPLRLPDQTKATTALEENI